MQFISNKHSTKLSNSQKKAAVLIYLYEKLTVILVIIFAVLKTILVALAIILQGLAHGFKAPFFSGSIG